MFDPITTTASKLQQFLRDGKLNSVDIVDVYLNQIQKHNHDGLKLNALISVAPRNVLLATASRLDQERSNGQVRSPLHGIPIVVKDSIVTAASHGMPTTNGSPAFGDCRALRNADCVERLVQAGMIILAKANLTEASGMKSPSMMPGWSPAGGQTQTPYVSPSNKTGDQMLGNSRPGGSSSGSAVAVAAGFAPLALGTEAVGSLITPANRAALYSLKLPPRVSPNEGVFGISTTFDGVGGLAKSAADLAVLTSVFMGQPGIVESLNDKILSIGVVDPRMWTLSSACTFEECQVEQMVDDYETAIERMRESGVSISYPVIVPDAGTLKPGNDDPYRAIAFHQCREIFAKTASMFENCSIETVADMVKWNKEHADVAMPKATCPDQKDLEDTLAFKPDPIAWKALEAQFRRLGGPEGVDPVFDKYNLEIIAAPSDSPFMCFAAAAGYPVGCVPMGVMKSSGRPFGICVLARTGGEQTLLHFMHKWESIYPDRALPQPIVDFGSR